MADRSPGFCEITLPSLFIKPVKSNSETSWTTGAGLTTYWLPNLTMPVLFLLSGEFSSGDSCQDLSIRWGLSFQRLAHLGSNTGGDDALLTPVSG